MEWISVKEKLPKKNKNVLLASNHFAFKEIKIGHYWCKENSYLDENEFLITGVTHWMPLPRNPNA